MKLYDTGVYLQNGKEIIPAAERPAFLFPEKIAAMNHHLTLTSI